VGPDPAQAIAVLRRVQADMERRYAWLAEQGKGRVKRKIEREDGIPLHLVVCDELAFYLNIDDRKQRDELRNLFRDLVSRGRAAGIIVVAATQKPSGDVIPTALRDLFGFRWALRCSTRDASDTILGAGWATLGYSAAEISGDQRGVGWLLAEDGQPERVRSYFLSDRDLEDLAARARTVRQGSEAPRCRSCGVLIDLDEYRKGA
jgi:S-DNA-T family DNA segregation ATPase FtsK/SpoIIIE